MRAVGSPGTGEGGEENLNGPAVGKDSVAPSAEHGGRFTHKKGLSFVTEKYPPIGGTSSPLPCPSGKQPGGTAKVLMAAGTSRDQQGPASRHPPRRHSASPLLLRGELGWGGLKKIQVPHHPRCERIWVGCPHIPWEFCLAWTTGTWRRSSRCHLGGL